MLRTNRYTHIFIYLGICLSIGLLQSCVKDPPPTHASPAVKAYLEEQVASGSPWGFIDKKGHAVIEAQYDAARPFSQGRAAVAHKGLWHTIDKRGQVANPGPFINIGLFENDLAICKGIDALSGIINLKGDTIIPFKYDDIFRADHGFLITQLQHTQGLLSPEGKELKPPSYSAIKVFDNKRVVLEQNNKFSLWDSEIRTEIPLDIERYIAHGVCVKDKLYSVINHEGKRLLNSTFKKIWRVDEHVIIVKNDQKKYGLQDLKGAEIIPTAYDKIKKLSSTHIAVKQDRLYALFDVKGNQLSDFNYHQFMQFDEGLAPIEKNKAWGYINTEGQLVIPPYLFLPWKCQEGMIRYYTQDGFGYMNKKGKEVISAQFKESRDFHEGLAAFQR